MAPAGPGVAVAHSAAPRAEPIEPTEGCARTETGYTCFYGPVDVPAGGTVEIEEAVDPVPEAGYLTSMRATLVGADGSRLAHHMVHLHHAVWVNPNKDDTTCEDFGGYPSWDRFFASGKERTLLEMPAGYGYYWDAMPNALTGDPFWGLVAHLDGMHGSKNVFVKLDLGFVPTADAEGYTDIDPIWLDVENCELSLGYDVRKGSGRRGVAKRSWTYTMPEGGSFIAMAGHLHDGGLRLVLRNVTTGDHLFTSEAIYGKRREPWYLTKMTSFSGLPGIEVAAGDVVKLTSVYDSTHRWRDVMGIMVGALVPAP